MKEQAALYDLGRQVIGPIFSHYVDEIIVRAKRHSLQRLWFVAREGMIFQDLYLQLCSNQGITPLPNNYVYLSRLSTALPAVHSFGIREVRLGLLSINHNSIIDLLRTFNLYDDEMSDLLMEQGLRSPHLPIEDAWHSLSIRHLLENNAIQEAIRSRAARARTQLKQYLVQQNAFSNIETGFIDIGWSGTIQNHLIKAFCDDPEFPRLHGLYFGLLDDSWQRSASVSSVSKEGVISDYRHSRRLRDRVPLHFLDIFELSARAAHGTTLHYQEKAGTVVPVLKNSGSSRDSETETMSIVAEIQRGIVDSAEDYTKLRNLYLNDRFSLRELLLKRLEKFVFFPTTTEIRAVSELTQSVDWGSDGVKQLVSAKHVVWFNPHEWLSRFHHSPWKPGYLNHLGGPLLNWLYHTYLNWR